MIQISNISNISVEPVPKKKLNWWSVFVFVIGIYLILQADSSLKDFGIGFIIVAGIYILWIICINDNNEEYLYIYLNSGSVYYILCENDEFLKKVMKVIKDCVNHHSDKKIRIDFNNCKVYNSPITIGDGNEVK